MVSPHRAGYNLRPMKLLAIALTVFLLNLPFGAWRGTTRKLSVPWFLAVHLPIPLVVLLRLKSGLGFHWSTYPALVGAYFLGQFGGGRLFRATRRCREALHPAGWCRFLPFL